MRYSVSDLLGSGRKTQSASAFALLAETVDRLGQYPMRHLCSAYGGCGFPACRFERSVRHRIRAKPWVVSRPRLPHRDHHDR
jgi:hypothetical protein